MEFVNSTRGNGRLLVLDGYVYSKHRLLANNVVSWECVNRRNAKSCMAKIKTMDDIEVGRLHMHTHAPDPEKIRLLKMRNEMKNRAKETMDGTRDILHAAVAAQHQEVIGLLPSEDTLRRDIRRNRQVVNQIPPVPHYNDLQFVLPQRYCVTAEGDQFLQVDSFADNSRMLLFGSQKGLDFLAGCPHWYMDGTFDTLPPQFMQLYTVHGIKNSRNVVGVYAMLTNKQAVTYERMLRHIRFLTGDVNPESINIDFEQAAINASRAVFPLSELSGCFFHLSQNIYRKVQQNHLGDLYANDVIFRENIRMVCALAFIPLDDVIPAFETLCLHCEADGEEQVILQYFERNYIGELRAGVRMPPIFPHELWSVYDRVINGLPRTTNALEGWHHSFKRSVGQCNATIWKFIDCLKREHAGMHLKIAHDIAGVPPPIQKRRYRDLNARILTVTRDYENRNTVDFLRAISYMIA